MVLAEQEVIERDSSSGALSEREVWSKQKWYSSCFVKTVMFQSICVWVGEACSSTARYLLKRTYLLVLLAHQVTSCACCWSALPCNQFWMRFSHLVIEGYQANAHVTGGPQ